MACRCASCYGLSEYLTDNGLPDRGLPKAPGHERLHVVTLGAAVDAQCNGTLTCPCPRCVQERLERQHQLPRRIRQPWEARTAA